MVTASKNILAVTLQPAGPVHDNQVNICTWTAITWRPDELNSAQGKGGTAGSPGKLPVYQVERFAAFL